MVINPNSIYDTCLVVSLDDSLLHAIRKVRFCIVVLPSSIYLLFPRKPGKLVFLSMPVKRYSINVQQYANNHLRTFENRELQDKLGDPVLFDLYESLKTGNPRGLFPSTLPASPRRSTEDIPAIS